MVGAAAVLVVDDVDTKDVVAPKPVGAAVYVVD